MFSKLQHDAAHIEMGVKSLRAKLPAVMTGYTYNDPDARPLLERRQSLADETAAALRQFIAGAERCERQLPLLATANAETERRLAAMAAELGLERCLQPAAQREDDADVDDSDGEQRYAEEADALRTDSREVDTVREREQAGGDDKQGARSNGRRPSDSPRVVFFHSNDRHETPALPSRSSCRIPKPRPPPPIAEDEDLLSVTKSTRRLKF